MREIREVLRLKFAAKLSHERIAAATGVSKGAVSNYLQRAIQKSLGWPLPEDLDDAALKRALFPRVLQCEQ
jgi:predicted transcriptional regulator